MANKDLEEKTWDEVIHDVQGMSAAASQGQMRSIMAVPAKAAIELGGALRDFNNSTARLTRVLIVLEVILSAATVLIAIAAFKG